MPSTVFPNGQVLTSSAYVPFVPPPPPNTTPPSGGPVGVANIFQPIIASILGIDPVASPAWAFSAVRLDWPQNGQPAWAITDNVVCIGATPSNDNYARYRDQLYEPNDAESLVQTMGFTQIWDIHFTIYGPNAANNARLIVSAMSLDWVHDAFAAANLYGVVAYPRPIFNPELFQGQWWQRADVKMQFNEKVTETLVVPSAVGERVTILPDIGPSETVDLGTVPVPYPF